MDLLDRSAKLWRRIVRSARFRLFGPEPAYRKVPLRTRVPRREPAEKAPAGLSWRACLHTVEVDDATALAGDLFHRQFRPRTIPDFPRHFVMLHAPGGGETNSRAVAYLHLEARDRVHLLGGLCVDEGAYRLFPRWLRAELRDEGGLATIITRRSVELLEGDAPVFGYVGDLRSRQAALRAGFVDTDHAHLMARWRASLPDEEKRRLVAEVDAYGPF